MPGYLPGALGFNTYVRILPVGVSRSTTVSVNVCARTGAAARARGAPRAARRPSRRSGALDAAPRLDSRPARAAAARGTAQHEARAPARAAGARPHGAASAPCSKLNEDMFLEGERCLAATCHARRGAAPNFSARPPTGCLCFGPAFLVRVGRTAARVRAQVACVRRRTRSPKRSQSHRAESANMSGGTALGFPVPPPLKEDEAARVHAVRTPRRRAAPAC